jgi:hypothetical protein
MQAINPNKTAGFIVEERYAIAIEAHGRACPKNAEDFK